MSPALKAMTRWAFGGALPAVVPRSMGIDVKRVAEAVDPNSIAIDAAATTTIVRRRRIIEEPSSFLTECPL
jgi:hypothetical protein